MAKYKEFLNDDIGNEYSRKNLYLLELAKITKKIEYASQDEKKRLKEELKDLKKKRNSHPYILELKEFQRNEKSFLKELRTKKNEYKQNLDKHLTNKLKNLKVKLFDSKEKLKFYKQYANLCYESTLSYSEAVIINNQMGEIIDYLDTNHKAYLKAKSDSKKLNSADENKVKLELKSFKAEQKITYDQGVKRLKDKHKKGLISDKALSSEKLELKKKLKAAILVKSYDSPKKSNKELIRNLNYKITKGVSREITVLKSNVADLRRKTPTETNRKTPVNAFVTALVPGIGQILNGQYVKSILFFMISLFIYGIAIPYALGYANYQGEGIAGLISLAEGGAKLDKSLIFMIEGILSIYLLIFAIVLLYLSFNDVYKVERDKIKGIRPRNWFETKTGLTEEGFPYMVSLPALFVTVFIVLVPITTAILVSFTGMDPKHQSKFSWIGLKNYKMIALGEGIAGAAFWHILGWTVVWTITATTLAIFIGFFLAILTNNERVKGKVFFRAVFLLPWAVPAFITIMFFSIMFSPNGALTEIITNIFGADTAIVVKNDPFLSRITLIMLQGWLGSAYVFLLSTGVLQAIPGDLYEAAQIDGATSWQKLKRITLPIVLFQTAPLLIGQYTFNFNNFSIIFLFNSGGPFNPSVYGNLAGSTDLLISYIFKLTTQNQYQAIGAAITVVISMGLMLFAFVGFKNSKAFKEEKL